MSSISDAVKKYLEEMSPVNISISDNKNVNIINDIKKTPRTGKSVRIDKSRLNLPKRSIYDHIISLGYQADIFLNITHITVNKDKLAMLIVFHDLAESITGDIPDFTRKELAGKFFLNPKQRNSQEIKANNLIEKSLPEYLRSKFKVSLRVFQENSLLEVKFFTMVDKTDPIIAIWRYLSEFRNQINFPSFKKTFIDYFKNPKVLDYCMDKKIKRIIEFLQNIENARFYYEKGPVCLQSLNTKGVFQNVSLLIENRKMHYI